MFVVETNGCPTILLRNQYLKVYGTKCYEFVLTRHFKWEEAAKDCQSKGGSLVTVNDIGEQNFIMSSLRALSFSGQGGWIGLNNRNKEGVFQWVSGKYNPLTQ